MAALSRINSSLSIQELVNTSYSLAATHTGCHHTILAFPSSHLVEQRNR